MSGKKQPHTDPEPEAQETAPVESAIKPKPRRAFDFDANRRRVRLKVTLTVEELHERAKALSEAAGNLTRVNMEVEAIKLRLKHQQKDAENRVNDLLEIIREKAEQRSVEVFDYPDVDSCQIVTCIHDTGEEFARRAMNQEETENARQFRLPIQEARTDRKPPGQNG